MDEQVLLSRARDSDVRLVRFLYCDNGGIIRGKATHLSVLADRLVSGIGLTVAMQAMTSVDRLASVQGLGPVGEIRLVPDPETFVVLPYAPHCAAMLVDMHTLDGEPWGACPRSFLKRMIVRARELGFSARVGFDPEWSLAVPDGNSWMPIDRSLCFSGLGMTSAEEVIDAIVGALEGQGLAISQYYPELGHGQQELSLHHADALHAADHHILYRETIRAVARQHGLVASFAPKPWPDQAGNGCHVHLSLWDESGTHNLFYDPAGRYQLSALGYQFLAGVLEHLPGLLALTCPSVNSYRRLQPQMWSSAFTCYGPDNREASVRIVSPYRGHEAATVHLELKPADNSANPYLAVGGVLAAGLDGIRRALTPPEGQLALVDPATIPETERAARGIRPLPATLGQAADALERDPVLIEALGPLLASAYLAVRRAEAAYFADVDPAREYQEHFEKY